MGRSPDDPPLQTENSPEVPKPTPEPTALLAPAGGEDEAGGGPGGRGGNIPSR